MADTTLPTFLSQDRLNIAQFAAEEIQSLIRVARDLPTTLAGDVVQQHMVQHTLLKRIEELADINWSAIRDEDVSAETLLARFPEFHAYAQQVC